MSGYYEIPLLGQAQTFNITIQGIEYQFTTRWYDIQPGGGWYLDIADSAQNNLVSGIAMVTGANLMAPYPDLAIGGQGTIFFMASDGPDPFAAPTFDNLGTSCHLFYYIPDPPVYKAASVIVETA